MPRTIEGFIGKDRSAYATKFFTDAVDSHSIPRCRVKNATKSHKNGLQGKTERKNPAS